MIITNSLGSNYTAEDRNLVLKLLLQPWRWREGKETKELKDVIPAKAGIYRNIGIDSPIKSGNDNVQLFMKGRQAIEEALKQIGVKSGDEIIVQAFTCVAVAEPILKSGVIPIYADVDGKSLNPSLENIKKVVSDKTKAVILQHTLGYINRENEEIVEWCERNNITVIQDLAHAAGAPALTAKPHKVRPSKHPRQFLRSDLFFIILSFSQDKVFDGISGGALISNQEVDRKFNDSNHQSNYETAKLLLYPLITYAIRATYNIGIGKAIHFLSKKLGLVNSPIYTPKGTSLPNAFAALALQQFNRLDIIIKHRNEIALQYQKLLNVKLLIVNRTEIESGSNLRYPIWVNNKDELESKLQEHNFYLFDHWYDSPVSPGWIEFSEVNYEKGSCPNAENLSKHIFNLPTHININVGKARELAKLINTYAE